MTRAGVTPSVLRLRDLCAEAAAGVLQRPARSLLTAFGTVLGVGSFVAVLGLTATASSQIDNRFTELSATEVTVEDNARQQNEFVDIGFPKDADTRVGRLNGVEHAGVYYTVRLPADVTVSASPQADALDSTARTKVVAASPGALAAAVPSLEQGRLYDDFAERTAAPVAVIGEGVARRLGITTLENAPAVFIGGEAFSVVGIVGDVERKADLLLSVVVPRQTADRVWGPENVSEPKMLIATRVGAAQQVADEAALALRPEHPEYFRAIAPPDPETLRSSVGSDLDQLFLLLASVCLVIGAVGIANTTLVAVLERTGEIGLRRALGARGRHIAGQFLAESGALGALGGLLGTAVGTVTVVAVAVVREWTPVIHPATVAAAPLVGLATGLLAGLYPAVRASRVQPVEALRR
ncbi:ABC transporter [Streptomyces davaonensis JCM 4913]|uniref:ABC transporter n=1 Tax=Streptomyces davaonensis (strain DSM 101723 / JCM 4913 / KCC S-0913 / 768) TaxID=1214101 RepID=K4R0U0_STRDJ|nr:ABC transporter permease [Streptomyces davaonensis]CCK29876.1 ABC transporter [Streptomyces davaonensis JCM 4913]